MSDIRTLVERLESRIAKSRQRIIELEHELARMMRMVRAANALMSGRVPDDKRRQWLEGKP